MRTSDDTRAGVRTTITVIGAFCAVASLVVLGAWLLGGSAAAAVADRMKANTALAFALLGVALCLRAHRRSPRITDVLALVLAAIGLLTLLQYGAGVDLGIDELLQREHSLLSEAALHPNRMAPNTAFSVSCLGLAVFAARRGRAAALTAQALGVVTFFTGFAAIVGYLYDASALFQPTPYIRMAGLTATLATAGGFAVVFLRCELGVGTARASSCTSSS